jgi:Ca2+/Na+ antiporter
MNSLKKMAPYLLVSAIAFNIIPLFGQSTGIYMMILLVVLPFICFITALVYGLKQGWNLLYPIMIGILFAPTVFLFYNSSAWIYCFGYSFLALVGVYLGKSIKENNSRKAI